jgi:beta-lactamase class C
MRHLLGLALLTCLTSLPISANAADRNELATLVDSAFVPLMAEHDVPGMAVAITIDGEHHFFNYGVSSLKSAAPVTEHTIFEIGSVSKTFTATLGGYALARGKLALTDKPSRHIPELSGSPIDKATLAHLATYTAGGLPLQFPDGIATDGEALSYLAEWQPDAAPGEIRRYSNPSIGFFGHLAARALDGAFGELLDAKIFAGLGLDHTFVRVPESHMASYSRSCDALRKKSGDLGVCRRRRWQPVPCEL